MFNIYNFFIFDYLYCTIEFIYTIAIIYIHLYISNGNDYLIIPAYLYLTVI